MKKITLISLACLFSLGIASAQYINFGIKGGLNYSKLHFDDVKNITLNSKSYNLSSEESFQGFHIGIMTRLLIFNAYIQPELYFTSSGNTLIIDEISGGEIDEFIREIHYNKVDLPVLIGYQIGPFRLNAGPVASVILNEDNKAKEIIPGLKDMSKSATIGFQAGIGMDIFKVITLDYRFEGGLNKWGEKISIGGNDYALDNRSSGHFISLGIMFR